MAHQRSSLLSVCMLSVRIVTSLLWFFILLSISSCDTNKVKGTASIDSTNTQNIVLPDSSKISPAGDKSLSTSNYLDTLFIPNNATGDSLGKLLRNNQKSKLIFQFYRSANGVFELLITPSLNRNQGMSPNLAIHAKRTGQQGQDLAGQEVVLGDLQLADSNPSPRVIRELRSHLYNASQPGNSLGWEYILLVPQIEPIEINGITRKYVTYKLERSSNLPSLSFAERKSEPIADGFAKPSPPRNLE